MLNQLSAIASALNLSFLFGEAGQINRATDNVLLFPLFVAEGYSKGYATQNPTNGRWRLSYNLDLWLLGETELDEDPAVRAVQLAALELMFVRVLTKLQSVAEVSSPVQFREAIEVQAIDRPLDGIKFTLTATPTLQPRIC